jgi:D-alanine-D-alanine ligase
VKSIWVICGGVSSEHDISIQSAHNIVTALCLASFQTHVVYINLAGQWHYMSATDFLQDGPKAVILSQRSSILVLRPGHEKVWWCEDKPDLDLNCDCVFPMVHGAQGEDGALQGLFNILDVPFVGSDIVGSAVCMAKHVAKDILRSYHIPVVPGVVLTSQNREQYSYFDLIKQFGAPLFVKSSASGSSIGVSRVTTKDEYDVALDWAFEYDTVVLIEQAVVGREIECSVLGNDLPMVSSPGEIKSHTGFYDFHAKYGGDNKASVVTPATLSNEEVTLIQGIARDAYLKLHCCGLARVDFFLTSDGDVYVNEVNTLPGFTNISMYPKNWEVGGLMPAQLVEKCVEFAFERYASKAKLIRSINGVCKETV